MKIRYTYFNRDYKNWKIGDKVKLGKDIAPCDLHLIADVDPKEIYEILDMWNWDGGSKAIKIFPDSECKANFAIESFIKVS